MAINCNLNHVVRTANNCKFVLPGTGDTLYVFDIDEVIENGVDGQGTSMEAIAALCENGMFDNDLWRYLEGRLYEIAIKSDSGHVTSEKPVESMGRKLTLEAIVNRNIEDFCAVDAAIAGRNVGALISDNSGNYYVIMSPYKETKYTSNYDSGTTYDSENGFTITFEVAPVLWGCPKVAQPSDGIKKYKAGA